MATESKGTGTPSRRSDSGGLVGGAILVVIGLVALAGQFIQSDILDQLLVPALGLIFLVWGAMTRRFGLLIPAGILLGIGAAALLVEGPFKGAGDQAQGGIFMIVFAAGWAIISLASALFTSRTRRWPLVVAAVLAVIGVLLLVAGPALNAFASSPWIWAVIMIVVGLYLLIFRREN